MMSKCLDIIIFGATGFTGRRTIPELNRLIKSEGLSLTWGVAGRSKEKLRDVLAEMEKKNGDDYSKIPIIVADVENEESLLKMTRYARLIINTIGPYRFYGEAIVKACVDMCTHHIDISGEPEYMENIQLKYHKEAMEKGIYLITSCGIDSIPADLGAIYMSKNFKGTLNSIETCLYVGDNGKPCPGPILNYTTWVSAIYGVSNYKKLLDIRSKLFLKKLPECKPKLQFKGALSKDKTIDKWLLPFPGADRSVMQRTQRDLYELYNQRPAQIQCYHGFEKLHNALLTIFVGSLLTKMCKYDWTRSLLLKHPKLFSMGAFTLEGPTEEKQQNTDFHLFLEGKGWNEKLPEPTDQFKTPPSERILVEVSGKNPGYGTTCTTVALSAITVLTESERMPNSGGCYSPGVAFANTDLINKLNKYGVKFELRSKL